MHLRAALQMSTIMVVSATLPAFGDTTGRQCPENQYFSTSPGPAGCRPCEQMLGACNSLDCVRQKYPTCVRTYEKERGKQQQLDPSSVETKSAEHDGLTTTLPDLSSSGEEENKLKRDVGNGTAGSSHVGRYMYLIIPAIIVTVLAVSAFFQCRNFKGDQQTQKPEEQTSCLVINKIMGRSITTTSAGLNTSPNIMNLMAAQAPLSECGEVFFECFKDCCKRGVQFCNRNPSEKRCQDCSLRESYCGQNQTLVPFECDLFCYIHQQRSESCQIGWVALTGWVVTAIAVAVLGVITAFWVYKKCKACHGPHIAGTGSTTCLLGDDRDDVNMEPKQPVAVNNGMTRNGCPRGDVPSSSGAGGAAASQQSAAAPSLLSDDATREPPTASHTGARRWGFSPDSPETEPFVVVA